MDIVTVERSSVMLLSRVIISLREGIEREGGIFLRKIGAERSKSSCRRYEVFRFSRINCNNER